MSELIHAIKVICEEKGLSYDAVINTIESALSAAYRKDFGSKNQNIKVEFDPETGKSKVFDVKTVVEDLPEEDEEDEASAESAKEDGGETSEKKESEGSGEGEEERKFNPKTEIQLSDAKLIKKTAKVGDEIKIKLEVPSEYGRMAAQTAKQVIIQRLREAERDMILSEFKEKEGEVVSGVVQRREGRVVLVDLGKAVGILPQDEQIRTEQYKPGERIKVFIKEVNSSSKGPEIILSRTSEEILKKVFYLEIPEISNGLIELKAVAREAGSRSKVAVWTDSDSVDPIGSCVGQRGSRIQTIISELGGEKVDIIEYSDDPAAFITNALSPAKIISIDINDEEKRAVVTVADDQLSLAIGKGGQNARLAARLTGWKVDIVVQGGDEKGKQAGENGESEEKAEMIKKEDDNKADDKNNDSKEKEEGGSEKMEVKAEEKKEKEKKKEDKEEK